MPGSRCRRSRGSTRARRRSRASSPTVSWGAAAAAFASCRPAPTASRRSATISRTGTRRSAASAACSSSRSRATGSPPSRASPTPASSLGSARRARCPCSAAHRRGGAALPARLSVQAQARRGDRRRPYSPRMPTTFAAIDRARVLRLTERERAALLARTPASQAAFERAVAVMPRGVPSSFQAADPRPTYLSHGEGSKVWDVDGNEYVDFHNGFGVMCVGHANPAIVRAVSERAAQGSHFAAPTEGSIVVAQELRRRFGLPQWRFTNSGTESTMDAIHLARAATGRDLVLKIEGSYHGHHDAVMVSVRPPLDQLGERGVPGSVPFGAGHPRAVSELTLAIPFNDADVLER